MKNEIQEKTLSEPPTVVSNGDQLEVRTSRNFSNYLLNSDVFLVSTHVELTLQWRKKSAGIGQLIGNS